MFENFPDAHSTRRNVKQYFWKVSRDEIRFRETRAKSCNIFQEVPRASRVSAFSSETVSLWQVAATREPKLIAVTCLTQEDLLITTHLHPENEWGRKNFQYIPPERTQYLHPGYESSRWFFQLMPGLNYEQARFGRTKGVCWGGVHA